MRPKLVFMGTPEAAVPTLAALVQECDVNLVVTQPDRPRGRSKTPQPPPVKEWALDHALVVAQPVKASDLDRALLDHEPFDLGVVVAYGRILGSRVLAIPEHGMLNVHFSLLPRWRGAAPVARALMAGDSMTGVTIMRMDEGLDTGPVLTAQAVDMMPEENAGALTRRLAGLGARLLAGSIAPYLDGELESFEQSDDGVTYAKKIDAADRPLEVGADPDTIVNHVRGLAPRPAASLDIDGERHKILAARRHVATPDQGVWMDVGGVPVVGFAGGGVELIELQPPGRKPQSGADWLRGRRANHGVVA